MFRFKLIIFGIALVLVSAHLSDATVYKWRDENGKLHFTDDPSKLPENERPLAKESPKKVPEEPASKQPEEKFYYGNPKNQSDPTVSNGAAGGIENGFQKMGDALGKGLQKGMQKMGEEMGKSLEGLGPLIIIAEENKPDPEKNDFSSEEEKSEYQAQQALLGMFMICQMQYIMQKSETCAKDGLKGNSKDGWKVKKDSKMDKIIKNHVIEIDPKRNTRENLLIKAHQNNSKKVWQITHEGKKSIQLFPEAR
ncbi:MAG: DUF4124 domain-containing protein [Nitrospinae bacterium]|nr:DUF4124 domain-containing protein [Nitrospinota bacterium]